MAAPLISSISPTASESGVYLNKQLKAVFDQAMLTSSINQNTVLLYRSSDYKQIEGAVTYDSSDNSLLMIPYQILDENAGYTFILVGADQSSACIKNSSSEDLASSQSVQFVTGTTTYEPPQISPDTTQPDDEVAPSPTISILAPATVLDFSVADTYPDNRETNIGTMLPSGMCYIAEPSGYSSIYATFNEAIASGVNVDYTTWVTVEATPVNGDPALPAGVPSGSIVWPSGYNVLPLNHTIGWGASDPSGWYQNNEVLVTLSKYILSASGNYLVNDEQFYFTTTYNPLYCTVRKIRTAIGPYIREVPDDTVNRAIFENSLLAHQLGNETYGQDQWSIDNPSFAAKMYTCCKTQYDLLNTEILNRMSNAGQLKRLGDFTVQEQIDIARGLKVPIDQSIACMQFWVDKLIGKTGKVHPKMAVKGINNSATPPMRGVRTWTKVSPGMAPAGNTKGQRRNKLPNIYDNWS